MVRPRVRKGSDKGRSPLWLDLDPKSVEKKSWINKSWILYRCIWRWIRVSKMNAVARMQLTFQMLILLKKYPYHQSQYSTTWDSKCLALITQMVRAFGMNSKVGGSRPPQVETFSVWKTRRFGKNTRSCVKNECCCPHTINISNVSFTSNMHM